MSQTLKALKILNFGVPVVLWLIVCVKFTRDENEIKLVSATSHMQQPRLDRQHKSLLCVVKK